MKSVPKLIILLYFTLISPLAHTQVGICAAAFENPRLFSRWLAIDTGIENITRFQQMANELPIDEKLDLYQSAWNRLSNRINQANSSLKRQIAEMQKKKSPQEIEIFKSNAQEAIVHEFSPLNDLMVEDLAKELNAMDISATVVSKKGLDTNAAYKAIEIEFKATSKSRSSQLLARYQKYLDIDSFTVDLFDNAVIGSLGFYHPLTKRIDIGPAGLKSILIDDLPTSVVHHEAKHAGFASNRHKGGQSSIYDSVYKSLSDTANITDDASLYTRFMSAEELFNWTQDLTWITPRFKNIKEYSYNSIVADLKAAYSKLANLQLIANQTNTAATNFSQTLRKYANEPGLFRDKAYPLTDAHGIIDSLEELKFMAFVDEASERMLIIRIPPDSLESAKRFYEVEYLVNTNISRILEQRGLNKAQIDVSDIRKLDERIRTEFKNTHSIENNEEMNIIVNTVVDHQQRLALTAGEIHKRAQDLQNHMDKFIEEFQSAHAQYGRSFLLTEEWNQKFLELRQRYREIGRYANEYWKHSPAYRPQNP